MAGRYVLDTGAVVAYADLKTDYTRRPTRSAAAFSHFQFAAD